MIAELLMHMLFLAVGLSIGSVLKIDVGLRVWVSYLVGLVATVQGVMLSFYILGYYDFLFIMSFLTVMSVYCVLKRYKYMYTFLKNRIFQYDLLVFFSMLIIMVIGLSDVLLKFSPDSFQFYALAETMYENDIGGVFQEFSRSILNYRLIFIDAVLMLHFDLLSDMFSSLFTIWAFVTTIITAKLIAVYKRLNLLHTYLLSLGLYLFSFSMYIFVEHSLWLHANLTTGIFLSLGALFLFLSGKNDNYRVLGFLFLAVTVLLRKEMVVVSLVPIGLFFTVYKCSLTQMYRYMLLYLIAAYQFWFFYLYHAGALAITFSGHGSDFEYVIGLFSTLLLPLFASALNRMGLSLQSKGRVLYLLYLIILIGLFLVDSQEFIKTLELFAAHTLFAFKRWGVVWLLLAAALFFVARQDMRLRFMLLHFLAIYFVFRIAVYFFTDLVDHSSGSRIMLHIVFVALFVVFSSLYRRRGSFE
ncbi:MAG: hypothetical protein ACQERD_09855 [Campylobacterota bacterium]